MEEEGYGDGYATTTTQPDGFSGQNYFPDELKRRPQYYDPPERGFEREIKQAAGLLGRPAQKAAADAAIRSPMTAAGADRPRCYSPGLTPGACEDSRNLGGSTSA